MSIASDPLDSFRSRLVSVVLRETWNVMVGMASPDAVGVPPVQLSRISLIGSAIPSARTIGATPTLAWHKTGGTGLVATDPITPIEKFTAETGENTKDWFRKNGSPPLPHGVPIQFAPDVSDAVGAG